VVITPTVTLTGTYGLWVDAGGNDVGAYVINLITGLDVLVFLAVFILGQYVALRLWP
jgi:hypothetical protein